MREVYHHPLEPRARYVRLVLAEKQLPFELIDEPFWQRRPDFMRLSITGDVPVMVEPAGTSGQQPASLTDAAVIAEYLEETSGTPPLMGANPKARAEVRRLVNWFLGRFANEVTTPLLTERMWKRLAGAGEPDTFILRAASQNLHYHMAYIQYLTERRTWLAGEQISLADLAAAAALSSLDYLGAISWEKTGEMRDWYAKIKSRPSFRALLADHLPGLPPAKHYRDLDF